MAFTANNYSLQKALQRVSALLSGRVLALLALLFAFLGFLDAIYLTIIHYKHIIPPCSLTHGGCETVLNSQFATIAGIPLALLGSLYYVSVFLLIALFLETKQRRLIHIAFLMTTLSLFISIWLIFLQAFVIHAFCQFCLGSELATFLLFDALWWLWRKLFKQEGES